MKFGQLVFVLLLCAAVAAGVSHLMNAAPGSLPKAVEARESAYERIMSSGVIRCGYIQYPKFIERDLKTGTMSGIYYEIMEEIGKRLSLKIDWTVEVGFADAFDGLKTGRYDVMCFAFNQTPGRARVTEFTAPIIFGPSFAYVRVDDARFDNDYGKINSPDVKVAFIEGELTQTIRAEDFPKTQAVSLTSLADISQVLMQVASGKADVAITEPTSAEAYMLNNPGKLKRVPGPPIRMQRVGVDVGVGEEELKSLLDTTIYSLLATGFVQRTVNKYVSGPDQLYFPAIPWGESAKPFK
jgi:ABC-type amino acid transport substrate-binding protein